MRIWIALVIGLGCWAEPPADLGVVYTGRLIGYARACAEERFVPLPSQQQYSLPHYKRECVGAGEGYGSALRGLLEKARQQSKQSLLLGVGDHFSLDYRARSVVVEGKDGPRAVGKDELYFDEPRGWIVLSDADGNEEKFRAIVEGQAGANSSIDGDAVAQFLIDAGYDALVPGKHDFYFGAERLRQVARLLARQSKPVQMLGANLVINGILLDPPHRVPERFRKKNYVDRHPDVSMDIPVIPLPWMRRVAVRGTGKFKQLVLCRVGKDGRDQACTGSERAVVLEPDADGKIYSLPKEEKPLDEVRSYHLCAQGVAAKGDAPPQVCRVFDVAQPYFQYGSENTNVPFPEPYFVDRERNAVVLGVVAPGLEKQIGLLNTVWLDPKKRHEIRVTAVDAIQSVEQLLDYCEAKGDCVKGRRTILLAQMPGEAAAAIQRRTRGRFDLVISEANPFTFTPFPSMQYPQDYPALVVSPRPVFDPKKPEQLALHAQMVHFDGSGFRTLAMESAAFRPATQEGVPLRERIDKAMQTLERVPGADVATGFRQLVLETMRYRVKGSVALLQKRDLFDIEQSLRLVSAGLKSDDDKLRAMVETLLWKGDFLAPRLVRGSALRRAMERSRDFDALDSDIYFYENEYNRGLYVLGIFQDPETRRFVVNGAPVEDDKPYLVAMTDFLAFGDTGYPELAQELVGGTPRAAALEAQPRISELVLDRLRNPDNKLAARGRGTNFGTYMDYLEWPGFPVEPEATLAMQFKEYFQTTANGSPQFPGMTGGRPKSNETLTQTRDRWRLVLERVEVAWSDYWNNQPNQSALLSAFEGITESRVATPETHALSASWAAELRRERFRSIGFIRSEGRLQSVRLENSESRFVHSYPQNEVALEGGWRMSMRRAYYQRPWLGWLLSGVLNSQPQNPLFATRANYFTGSPGTDGRCPAGTVPLDGNCKATLAYDAMLGRTTRALVKAGLRRETRDSWAETGFFAGAVRRPREYQLEDLAPCQLRFESLRSCLDNNSRVLPGAKPAERLEQNTLMGGGMESGVFMNFSWRVPLTPSNSAQLVLENRGRWYFNHGKDIPLDTRLSNLFSMGLSIPIAGRLALKPSWTLFHYLNKSGLILNRGVYAQRPGVLLMGNTFDIRAEYRFDWTEGQAWLKVLRYGGGR
ncbi:MAG: hypothetical protein HYX27_10280 [Acidobacteria bacterium]|nr:hypothetical protein [Acidobacteriota bacterium]